MSTSYFLKNRYERSNHNHNFSTLIAVSQKIPVRWFHQSQDKLSPPLLDSFKQLAKNFGVDVNLYNKTGRMLATTQSDIINYGLQEPIINFKTSNQFKQTRGAVHFDNEKIGKLNYNAGYKRLVDQSQNTLGYINIPFFASQKELEDQTANIFMTLINLYALIFLIASFISVLIIKGITRSHDELINHFSRMKPGKYDPIKWNGDDEMAGLVAAYNKMAGEIDRQTRDLLASERDSAWREMARQVAHEIKNPLTPMKLNIQYLQKVIAKKQDGVEELVKQVTATVIEQIDHLSGIASSFSDFARMPVSKPEVIDACNLLKSAIDLFDLNNDVTINCFKEVKESKVYLDKGQLLTVYNNLLQNAIQATSAEDHRVINVTATDADHDIIISFKDFGTGISDEAKAKIFSPYFTSKSSGTGLGLAMSKKIIESFDGSIWFENNEDVGATFFVRLPKAAFVFGKKS